MKTKSYWYVYLVKCIDDTIYTGFTSNLKQRILTHQQGKVKHTSEHLPIELLTCIAFTDKNKAYDFEKYLKSGSGKAFSKRRFL